ncbi:MAG: DOMON domain-containing protein [Candidatus Heimdallarchaeota archaeon]
MKSRKYPLLSFLICSILLLTLFSIHFFHYYRSLGLVANDALLSSNNKMHFSSITTPAVSSSATNTIPYNQSHSGAVDGLLEVGEYQSQFEISLERNMTIFWEHNGTIMFWAVHINVSGYFSIGWPTKGATDAKMNELDMIFTVGNGSGVFVIDNHATGRYTHGPDADQSRVVSYNQSGSLLEMTLRMASDDPDDIPLESGETYEFWFVWHPTSDDLATPGHERNHDSFLIETAEIDTDQDGLSDADEVLWGTNSTNSDSDDDGLLDGWEAFWELKNGSREDPTFFDPTVPDTDGDGTNDALEDYDDDSLTSSEEVGWTTNPLLKDTDEDGLSDGEEVAYWNGEGISPLTDSDGDGIPNILDSDSDNDVLSDGDEIEQGRDPGTPSANIPYTDFHQGAIDGAISESEYHSNFTGPTTNVLILWEHDGQFLYIALISNTTGWISFGWSTGEIVLASGGVQMTDMDMVIGRVTSGNILEVTDHHGTSNWTHAPDLDFAQIEEAKGLDNGYTTTIEFALHLGSPDKEEDVPLIPGEEYYLALAYGIHDELGLHDGVTRTSERFYIAESGEGRLDSDEEKDQPFLDLMTILFLSVTGFLAIGIVIMTLYRSGRAS